MVLTKDYNRFAVNNKWFKWNVKEQSESQFFFNKLHENLKKLLIFKLYNSLYLSKKENKETDH